MNFDSLNLCLMAGSEPWEIFILFYFSCRDVCFVAFFKFENYTGLSKHVKMTCSVYFGFLFNIDI